MTTDRRGLPVDYWLFLGLCLAFVLSSQAHAWMPPAQASPAYAHLGRDTHGQILIVGKLRIRLPGKKASYPFDQGILRQDQSPNGANRLKFLKPGKQIQQIDLGSLLNHWLKNNAFWGGQLDHHMVTGGVDAILSEFHPLTKGQALGVLNIHYLGSSIPYTAFQFLVKFTANPLKMTVVRRLTDIEVSPYEANYENPRLYSWKIGSTVTIKIRSISSTPPASQLLDSVIGMLPPWVIAMDAGLWVWECRPKNWKQQSQPLT